MRVRDLMSETVSALDANRGRSLLTVLGIVIGISAVIAMTALIGGIKQSLVGELGLDRARVVTIYVGGDKPLYLEDVERLRERLPQYESLAPRMWYGAKMTSETKSIDGSAIGVVPEYFDVTGLKLLEGSFFSPRDEADGALVAVADQGAVRNLFGNNAKNVVGKAIKVEDASYQIVGVVESSSMDDSGVIYIPFSTCGARISGDMSVGNIIGLATDEADMSTIEADTKAILADYCQMDEEQADEDLYVYSMQSTLDELDSMMGGFQLIMTAVAGISLLVGGIGIMNMMLTNVTERIREIGLRKALGARSADITMQFLLESVCLCVTGGIIGIICGYLGAYVLGKLSGSMVADGLGLSSSQGITPVIDLSSVIFATTICVVIGIVFGYYPARQAAKLDPVESLHYQ